MENRERDNLNDDSSKNVNHDANRSRNENSQPDKPSAKTKSDPARDPRILDWARKFLPEYFSDQPADFHRELMSDLADPKKRQLARVAPRGHAKSTCISLAYPLWAICEKKRRNIVIVSNESTLAKQFVRDIRTELETNPQIRETYGDLFAPPGPTTQVVDEPSASQSQAPEAARSEPQALARGAARSEPQAQARGARRAPAARKPQNSPTKNPTPTQKKPTKKTAANSRRRPTQTADALTEKTATSSNTPTQTQSVPKSKQRRPKNSESYFTTTTGITVQAKGAGAAFRGLRVGPNRPDLILCDDIEKDAQVSTAEGRQKLEHWLRRVVLPALAPDGRIVVIGSILHSESLLATLADAKRWPRWDYRVYRALEAIPSVPQAQARGASEPDAQAREATEDGCSPFPIRARAEASEPTEGGCSTPATEGGCSTPATEGGCSTFPGSNGSIRPRRPDLLQSGIQNPKSKISSNGHPNRFDQPPPSLRRSIAASLTPPVDPSLPTFHLRALWPARWPVARLLEERERIGTLAFEQEYQANPIDDALRVFRPDRLHRTTADEIEKLDRENRLSNILAIDPATGTTSGDYFALWAGGVDSQTGVIHTRELTLERIGIVEQVQRIVAACRRYAPVRVGIETVAYQAALHQVLEEVSRSRNLYIPLVPIKTVANKRARIEGSACFYESGTFRLPAFLPPEVELQFLQFPKARHDDAPDVCAMAIELARSLRTLTGSLVLFRRVNNPFNRPGGL